MALHRGSGAASAAPPRVGVTSARAGGHEPQDYCLLDEGGALVGTVLAPRGKPRFGKLRSFRRRLGAVAVGCSLRNDNPMSRWIVSGVTVEENQFCYGGAWRESSVSAFTWTITPVGLPRRQRLCPGHIFAAVAGLCRDGSSS